MLFDIIQKSQNLTEIFYKNLAASPQLKVFANIVEKDIQKKVIQIFKSNFTLLRALR